VVSIATNSAANRAVTALNNNAKTENTLLQQLATGTKFVSADIDASGQAITKRIASDLQSLQQASQHDAVATSILQSASSSAGNISDILARMKSLASESESGTTTDQSRGFIQSEFDQLNQEITSIAKSTTYGTTSLLDGTGPGFTSGVAVMVGTSATDTITMKLPTLTASSLGISALNVSTVTSAALALTTLDSAINQVSSATASMGALLSRFNFSAASINTQTQSLSDAKSAVSDTDIAATQASLSSAEVQMQAAVAAQTAADSIPNNLLKLLG